MATRVESGCQESLACYSEEEPMPRYARVLKVQPGFEQDYENRHVEIWAELIEEIGNAGRRIHAIFRFGLTLFGTFECADI